MGTVIQQKTIITDVKQKMSDILIAVSRREIARTYFGKSSSWLYHKLDGIDGNGGTGGFTPDEAKLRVHFFDIFQEGNAKVITNARKRRVPILFR